MKTNKKANKILIVVFIWAALFAVGWLLGKTGLLRLPVLPDTGSDNAITTTPTVTTPYAQDGDALANGDIWTVDSNTSGYYDPTIEELDGIYKAARKAKYERDRSAFQNYATEKILFFIEHTLQYQNFNKDGLPILQIVAPSGPEFFEQYAGLKSSFPYPSDLSLYIATAIEPFQFIPDLPSVIIDQLNGTSFKMVDPPHEHYYALYYRLNGLDNNRFSKNNPDENWEGRVYFAWDHGKWRFNTEDWFVLPVPGTATGDVNVTAANTVEVNKTDPDSDVNNPVNITINAGDKIRWNGANGTIGSTSSSNGLPHWNSSRLTNQSFEKVFNQKGTYQYSILTWDHEFKGEITVN